VTTPTTYLSLSEDPQVLPARWGSPEPPSPAVAARFEDLLELAERARVLGYHDLAEVYADRIVDEMLGGVA
jgi:hypothetical protein